MTRTRIRVGAVAITLAMTAALAGCASSGAQSSGSSTIKIGASLPMSGPLAGFGTFQKWGYERAVKQVNDAGGISVDGQKKKVELTILDDGTDPNKVTNNITELITKDNVDALLGSCTDTLTIPGALAADRRAVPFVTGCTTTDGFAATQNWTWAWALFFSAKDLTETPFAAVKELGISTNNKVAILHANSRAEQVIGEQLWPAAAKQYGWDVVYNASLPPDTTQFTDAVAKAKASGADMVLSVFAPPSAIALRKQLKAADYSPKILQMEEGGEPEAFSQALGSLADGVMVSAYWDPSFPYQGASTLSEAFTTETGQTSSQHIADSYTAAQVLLDAFASAATTDKTKVNDAIGKTDKEYVVGPVKFESNHTSTIPTVQGQWQGGKFVIVSPKDRATAQAIVPLP